MYPWGKGIHGESATVVTIINSAVTVVKKGKLEIVKQGMMLHYMLRIRS